MAASRRPEGHTGPPIEAPEATLNSGQQQLNGEGPENDQAAKQR